MANRKYCNAEDIARVSGIPVAELLKLNIDRFIEQASTEIERATGYVFEAVQDTYDTWSPTHFNPLTQQFEVSNVIEVPHAPIISVTNLTIDGEPVSLDKIRWFDRRIYLLEGDFGINKQIHIEYTYGLTNEVDRELVRKLCVYLVLLEMADTPEGRNLLFKNSVFAQLSAGDVRPTDLPQNIINDLVKEVQRLYALIPRRGEVW